MKSFSNALCILFLSSFLTVAVAAQKVETESELFSKISTLTQTKKAEDQDKAYQFAKVYMSRFGTGTGDEVKKVRSFMETYESAFVGKKIDEGKTAEAFAFGKEAFAASPDNTHLAMALAYGGYQAFTAKKDKSFGADSIQYAQKALRLMSENKLPASFQPFADRDEATALMYYVIGNFSVDSNLSDAARNFYKAVQFNSRIKNNSYPYYIIAFSYEKEYEKAAKEYEAKFAGGSASTDSQAAEARLEKLLLNMQDAYARAIKLGEAENAPKVSEWKKRFVQLYSFIKGSEAGSAEFLNGVLMTPLPDPSAQ